MKTLRYSLQFLTPAFMGNAEQNAQWRTPPIKALLRQWWRVAYAAENNFAVRVDEMRKAEGLLFGVASDEKHGSRKSQVRIRLDRWDVGKLKKSDWPQDSGVPHPEVKNRTGQIVNVGSALYLGYGALEFSNGTTLKNNAAIQAEETAQLSIAVPYAHAPIIKHALWLMDRYGTLGGRSRNGWGSFALLPSPPAGEGHEEKGRVLHPWRDCLHLDWPHAIGEDENGALIWQTAAHDDWKSLMRALAALKIGLRTQFHFTTGRDAPAPEARHWLSYPVTNHSVKPWGNNARLPNTLRFKARKTADGRLVGVIFHVPHLPPAAFNPNGNAIASVWHKVYTHLDTPAQNLTRIPE